MYWHNWKAGEDNSIYRSSGKSVKTKRNATHQLLKKDDQNFFEFKVYYDDISEEQLKELIWCLNFGEND